MRATLLARLEGAYEAERFLAERAMALPLAAVPFDARKPLAVSVSRRSLVQLDGGTYSVPCAWAGLDAMAYVGPDDVRIVGPQGACVVHPRVRFGARAIDYRHYIRELATKPQAVRQVAAPLLEALGPVYAATWRSLVDGHGPKQAARIFAKVLGFVEVRGIEAVAHTLQQALAHDTPPLLALAPAPTLDLGVAQEALPTCLRGIDVPSALAAEFDALFRGTR
jgi:hypothetical protein